MSTPERPMVHVRLSRDLIGRIDHLAVDRGLDRSRMVEHLVELGFSYTRPAPLTAKPHLDAYAESIGLQRVELDPADDLPELPLD